MPLPFSTAEKLRIQFRKELRRGTVKNAELDPMVPSSVASSASSDEKFIVRVDRTKGGRYWFSDRRVLFEDGAVVREVVRYEVVRSAHWMFKDLDYRMRSDLAGVPNLKSQYFDRLEIDIGSALCVLDNLGQSYVPTLNFLWWILREK